jgi:hypothetical protein
MANQYNENSKEIDLTQLSKHMKRFYARVGNSFFDAILFVKRNIIIIGLLFVAGAALGYFMDKGSKSYENKILVTPNFKSTDYLYEQVDLLNKKILENDTVFLKGLGIKTPKIISKISVEAVTDLYGFINDNPNMATNKPDTKYDIFRTTADKGDLTNVIEDPAISKNYKYHLITFNTGKAFDQAAFADPILKYLNSSTYYTDVQQQFLKTIDQKIAVNDSTITQIDRILNDYTSKKAGNNTVFYNDANNLGDLIRSKTLLLKEQEQNRVDKVDYTRVIKDNAILLNIKKISILSGKMKIIVPLMFIGLFVLFARFVNFYKKQSAKRAQAAG